MEATIAKPEGKKEGPLLQGKVTYTWFSQHIFRPFPYPTSLMWDQTSVSSLQGRYTPHLHTAICLMHYLILQWLLPGLS